MLPSRPAMEAPKSNSLASAQPFSRADLERGSPRLLARGRWANAVVNLFDHGGTTWVVKDFRERSFMVRNLIGRLLVRREARSLGRVDGLPHMPQGVLRIDATPSPTATCPAAACAASRRTSQGPSTFRNWNARSRRCIKRPASRTSTCATPRTCWSRTPASRWCSISRPRSARAGCPARCVVRGAGRLRRHLQALEKRSPETLGPERLAALGVMNRLRPLWVARGYIGAPGSGKPRN